MEHRQRTVVVLAIPLTLLPIKIIAILVLFASVVIADISNITHAHHGFVIMDVIRPSDRSRCLIKKHIYSYIAILKTLIILFQYP